MATSQIGKLIQHLRRAVRPGEEAGHTDGQLLDDFLSRREDAAFAALIKRHGPMVWGVCRRVLSNHHDAEDAFQATFLVLVRKAAAIASREGLAGWLHGVAYRTALKARTAAARRGRRERQVVDMPEPAVVQPQPGEDLRALVDQELNHLPEKYRLPVILCDLEGQSYQEAAGRLGCPEGTLAARLSRARALLEKRLMRRGVLASGGLLAAVLAPDGATAAVPVAVAASTIQAAALLAAGQAVTGSASAAAITLMEGVLKDMVRSKIKTGVVVVLLFAALGAGVLTYNSWAAAQDLRKATDHGSAAAPRSKTPQEGKRSDPEAGNQRTGWGEPRKGLRIGVRTVAAKRAGSADGDFRVILENAGTQDLVVNLGIMFANGLRQVPTAVRLHFTDAKGKTRVWQRKVVGVAGRLDPFVVPLPAGGRYEFPCLLSEYIDVDVAGMDAPLAPGRYQVAVEFAGTGVPVEGTNHDSRGLALMPYWTGTIRSSSVFYLHKGGTR
jgi:RNA polymerase sigma factor (sigma-70 family)